MKIKKIIYLTHFIFGKRDYERFGIETMKNNGFCVEVWDCTPFLKPKEYKIFKVPDPIDYQEYSFKLFKGSKDIKNQIEHLETDAMIIFLGVPNYQMYPILKNLSRANIIYALAIMNTIPLYKNSYNNYFILNKKRLFYIINKIKELNLVKLKKLIYKLIPYKWLGINFPELIFAGGSQTLINYNPPIGEKTKVIWGHTLDYDLYLKDLLKHSKNDLEDEKYTVFIDDYLPFAEDYIHMAVKNPTTPECYYPSLCKFFKRVEKDTGFKIVIAAHPRSMYEKQPDYFEGRSVIRGRTKELIRDSEFVLMHASTAMSFVILYNKPVLNFVTKEIEQDNNEINHVKGYCLELNKGYINIDESDYINWDKELTINKETYANYKEKYIKRKGTKRKFFWQIVADEIKKI